MFMQYRKWHIVARFLKMQYLDSLTFLLMSHFDFGQNQGSRPLTQTFRNHSED